MREPHYYGRGPASLCRGALIGDGIRHFFFKKQVNPAVAMTVGSGICGRYQTLRSVSSFPLRIERLGTYRFQRFSGA